MTSPKRLSIFLSRRITAKYKAGLIATHPAGNNAQTSEKLL